MNVNKVYLNTCKYTYGLSFVNAFAHNWVINGHLMDGALVGVGQLC
jgi:hypothetical protein